VCRVVFQTSYLKKSHGETGQAQSSAGTCLPAPVSKFACRPHHSAVMDKFRLKRGLRIAPKWKSKVTQIRENNFGSPVCASDLMLWKLP
ncbi:MAG: hypothetical protein WCL11_27990, partial [Verrucomicrobiota bacterium]